MNGTRSPEYRAYDAAYQRCNNPKNNRYHRYGGRGIEFRFVSFKEFFAEVGLKPSLKHSIGRMNNNGHYEVGNVRWETVKEQMDNRPMAKKLTVAKVHRMRRLHNEGRTFSRLARLFRVSPTTVLEVCTRKTWKNV